MFCICLFQHGEPALNDSCTQTRLSVLRDPEDVTQDRRLSNASRRPARLLPSTSGRSCDGRTSRIPLAVAPGTRPHPASTNVLSSTRAYSRLPQPGGSTGLPTRSRSVSAKNGATGYPRFVVGNANGHRSVRSASPLDRERCHQKRPQVEHGRKCVSNVESDRESGYGDTLPATSTELIASNNDSEDISGHPVQLVVVEESVGSHEDVLAAVLEADLAMQAMMTHNGVRRHDDASSVPVRVMLMHDARFVDRDRDSPLTDSAKQARLKIPLRQSSPVSHRLPLDHSQYVNVNDRTYDGSSAGHLHRSDMMWMSDDVGNLSSGTVRRQIEVIQHDVTQSTHILQPNTRLFSDDDDDDDDMSWPSGMTEPDPEGVNLLSSKDWGTQTLRTRTTQTPEDAQTQTPRDRRRKLPSLPGQSSRSSMDLGSDDISVVSGDSNDSTRMQVDVAGPPRNVRSTVKRRKLPGFQAEPANRETANVGVDHTDSAMMRTMQRARTDSMRIDPGNRDVTDSPLLRATKEGEAQPAYLKEYQEYIESFDGTMTETCDSDRCYINRGGHNMVAAAAVNHSVRPKSAGRALESGMRSRVIASDVSSNPNISCAKTVQRSTDDGHRLLPSSARRVQSARAVRRQTFHVSELRVQPSRECSVKSHNNNQLHDGSAPDKRLIVTAVARTRNTSSDSRERVGPTRVRMQDFSQQTACHHSTQTPLKLRICFDGVSNPGGTVSFGDTFVIDANERPSSHVVQPWQLIGRDDLDIQSTRDFATQTFGQSYQQSHSHIETQTNELGLITSVPPYTPILDDATQTIASEQTQTHIVAVESQQHVDIAPIQIMHSSVREEPTRDVETQRDIFDTPRTKKEKKKRARHRSDATDAASQSATVQPDMTKMDILKFMLKQVRDLKSQISPAETSGSRKREKETKKKHKSKDTRHKHKHDVSDSVVNSFEGEREKLYTKRRLELMYKRPDDVAAGSDPESRQQHRRRHSTDSYMSERLDRERRDYDELRGRYLSRSRFSYPQGRWDHSASPMRRGVSAAAAHGRLYDRPAYRPVYQGGCVSMGRKYSPQFQTTYPPPPPLPAPLTPRVPRMTSVVPPPPQYVAPATAEATQLQLGQGAFRPISAIEAQQVATPIQQNASIVFIPNTQQQQPQHGVAQSPYIVIASPYRYDSMTESLEGKENVHVAMTKEHKPRPSSARLVDTEQLDAGILKATRAANEMKQLTRRLKHK